MLQKEPLEMEPELLLGLLLRLLLCQHLELKLELLWTRVRLETKTLEMVPELLLRMHLKLLM